MTSGRPGASVSGRPPSGCVCRAALSSSPGHPTVQSGLVQRTRDHARPGQHRYGSRHRIRSPRGPRLRAVPAAGNHGGIQCKPTSTRHVAPEPPTHDLPRHRPARNPGSSTSALHPKVLELDATGTLRYPVLHRHVTEEAALIYITSAHAEAHLLSAWVLLCLMRGNFQQPARACFSSARLVRPRASVGRGFPLPRRGRGSVLQGAKRLRAWRKPSRSSHGPSKRRRHPPADR